MIRILLLAILFLPFASCDQVFEEKPKDTWIGGQIINPRGDKVLVFKDNKIVDSAQLDSKAFFRLRLDSIQPGIYSFYHHEYQVFYLEPGDSLMLRVNTVDFDESLTYTGRGADRNNLLMDLFLINEKENTLIPTLYRLRPDAYQEKIDSLRDHRLAMFDAYLEQNTACKGFEEVVLGNINYDHYSKKELYTSAHASNPNLRPSDFPEDFYDYRDSLDFSNVKLRGYFPYYRFLNRYFDNLAFEKYKTNGVFLNRNSFDHNFNKIHIIDSLVGCRVLKNNLLRTCTKRYLIHGKDVENEKQIVALFNQLNNNAEHHREIAELVKATVLLTPGNILPDIQVVDYDNQTHNVLKIIKRPTVLYFWSSMSVNHSKNLHSRAAELKSKYPEYDFKGINTDSHFRQWQKLVKSSDYDLKEEFQLENLEDAERRLLINSVNKAIIVDRNGRILDANTNLYSPTFEESLLGYLNI